MAATIEETLGIDREGRVYTPLPDSERTQQVRLPIDPRYEEEIVLPLSPRPESALMYIRLLVAP